MRGFWLCAALGLLLIVVALLLMTTMPIVATLLLGIACVCAVALYGWEM